jgi:hypothetical protein
MSNRNGLVNKVEAWPSVPDSIHDISCNRKIWGNSNIRLGFYKSYYLVVQQSEHKSD